MDKDLSLVELETEWVRFSTLNHRTKAEQLREVRKRGRTDLFTADPLGSEAQEAQFAILTGQQRFGDLKDDLLERGQQEPAIVTADGVLINGNRRTAALRLLLREGNRNFAYVRCFVLPKDATAEEILFLEAELQVAHDFREDYSWINEALMIEELYQLSGRNWDHVAAQMHRQVGHVQTQHEKLLLVHQLVDQSQGTRLHLDFTDNESAFEELAKHLRSRPALEGESIKSVYFAGILSGVNYRQLRHLRRDDAAQLVERELTSEPTLQGVLEAARGPRTAFDPTDVLSEFLGEEAPDSPFSDLLDLVATQRREEVVELPDGTRVDMEQVIGSLANVVAAAAHEADERSREQDAVEAPLKRAEKAMAELQRIPGLLPKARTHGDWSEAAFQEQIRRLEKALAEIRESR
ncbi:ParB N-terminal domain-containing protein [Streptomyces inusitatus]|nr:ParB N-terminal domain-containing protein [Streptomyces inusitatus]